eukprot:gene11488-12524_t
MGRLTFSSWGVNLMRDVGSMVQDSSSGWGPCPPSQDIYGPTYLRDCITLQFPLDRSNPTLGTVNAFLRRLYAGSAPTNTTLWLLEGGPGYSTRPFIPVADYFISENNNLTAYLLDARGTGLSSLLTCNTSGYNPGFNFNPFNETLMNQYKTCNEEIIAKYSNVSKYYNVYDSALDFLGAVNFINPGTISVYSHSYGTFFINTYLQLPGARADCLIIDGPVPPNRWPLEDSALMNSWVSQEVVNLCVTNSSVCENAFSVMGNYPQLISQAVKDRTLPCVEKLPWLNQTGGHFLTEQYTNFMTGTQSAQVLLGPFWFRLHRCSDSDIEQLNYFYNVYTSQIDSNEMSVYDYSYGLGMNLGANELYSFEGNNSLTYDQQVLLTNRLFATGGGELSVSYAIYESKLPSYKPNPSTYKKFANITIPVLILVGTLDPNTIQGLGFWYKQGLGNSTTLVTVPYAVHGTVNPDATCVNQMAADFINSLGQGSINTTCLNSLQPPDFDGSEASTQSYSLHYFNTTDLWNNGNQRDLPPSTSTCPTVTTSNDDNDNDNDSWSQSDVDKLIVGLVVPFSVITIAMFAYIVYVHVFFTLTSKAKPPLAKETQL